MVINIDIIENNITKNDIEIDNMLKIIEIKKISNKIKREFKYLIKNNICNLEDISIDKQKNDYHINININNIKYTFIITIHYPFRIPKMLINDKQLNLKHKQNSNLTSKYIGIECFLCNSKFYDENWSPSYSMLDLIEENNTINNYIQKVKYNTIINVIKRKYLNDDIDIINWLYY